MVGYRMPLLMHSIKHLFCYPRTIVSMSILTTGLLSTMWVYDVLLSSTKGARQFTVHKKFYEALAPQSALFS